MTQYTAPLRDMNFVLNELAGLAHVAKLPGFEDAGPETVERDPRRGSKVRFTGARAHQR